MWGIRIADGTPFAVFIDPGLAPLAFVTDEDTLPQIADDYMERK
jgi:hypothetical protein